MAALGSLAEFPDGFLIVFEHVGGDQVHAIIGEGLAEFKETPVASTAVAASSCQRYLSVSPRDRKIAASACDHSPVPGATL